MRIFYLSNHVGQLDFDLIVKNAQVKPNPAGQNFHGKLIEAFAKIGEVTCFSLVPTAEDCFEHKVGIKGNGIPHYYFYPPKRSFIPKAFTMPGKIIKSVLDHFKEIKPDETFVVYDTLNLAIARTAKMLSKKLGCRRIAVCTDDPFNITGASDFYISSVLRYSKDADAYFCLTKGLEELFNVTMKPYLIRMGIVESVGDMHQFEEKPYIYYGGALFYKDGTDALLQAYQEAKPNCKLIISGHGPSSAKVIEAAKDNPNIVFLGQISKQDNYSYEAHASLCINPRLYRGYLDKVSVPSKVMEYLRLCPYVASTLSTPIKEIYPEAINWIESDPEIAPKQLAEFFKAHMDENGNLIGLKENTARETILSEYGVEGLAKQLNDFISSL